MRRGRWVLCEAGGGVLLLVVALVVAVGSAGSRSSIADGGAWVFSPNGSVHVDGASGSIDARLTFACGEGHVCRWVQRDGQTYLYNETTGELRRLDPANLRLGRGTVLGGGDVDVVAGAGRLYAVARSTARVAELEPTELEELSAVELGGAPASDGVVDGDGRLWAVSEGSGELARVAGGARELAVPVARPGDGVELSLVGEGLVVVNEATSEVRRVSLDGDAGAPVGYPGTGPVKLARELRSSDVWFVVESTRALVQVDLAAGLARAVEVVPGGGDFLAPVPFQGKVYVGMEERSEVLVFDPATGRFEEPVRLRGGPVEVFEKDGFLYLNGKDGDGWVVDRYGRHQIDKQKDVPFGEVEGSDGITPLPQQLPTPAPVGPVRPGTGPPQPEGGGEPPPGAGAGGGGGGQPPGTNPPVTTPPGPLEPEEPPERGGTELPGRPSGVQATAVGAQVTVSWSPPSGGADSYQVRSLDGTVSAEASAGNGACSSVASRCVFSDVAPGTYRFTVQGRNRLGSGDLSDPSNEVTVTVTDDGGAQVEAPGVPEGLALDEVSPTLTRATWRPPTTGGPVDGYRVEVGGATVAEVGAGQTSVDLPATACTPISVAVHAHNDAGNSGRATATSAGQSGCPEPGTIAIDQLAPELNQVANGLSLRYRLTAGGDEQLQDCTVEASAGGQVGTAVPTPCPPPGNATSPSAGAPVPGLPARGSQVTATVRTGGGNGPSDSASVTLDDAIIVESATWYVVDCKYSPGVSQTSTTYGTQDGGGPWRPDQQNFSGDGGLPECPSSSGPSGSLSATYVSNSIAVTYSARGISSFTCYLQAIDESSQQVLDQSVDYACPVDDEMVIYSLNPGSVPSGTTVRVVLRLREDPFELSDTVTAP